MSGDSVAEDLFKYTDPSPFVEQDILRRVQRQLDMLPVIDQVCGSLQKLSSLMSQAKDAVISISTNLKLLSIDTSIETVLSQFSNALDTISRVIADECNLNIDAFRKFFFPGLEKVRGEFTKWNSETQKELEEWAQIPVKAKPEVVSQHEALLEQAMCNRAAAFYELGSMVRRSESTVHPVVTLAMATFVTIFGQYLGGFQTCKELSLKDLASKSITKQKLFKTICEAPPPTLADSEAFRYASRCWSVRRRQLTATDDVARASSVMWIYGKKFVSSWSRKYVVFADGVLTFHDPTTGDNTGSYPLLLVTIAPVSKGRRNCFKIQSPNGDVLYLEALTQWDVAEWQSIINEHNEKILLGNEAGTAAAADGAICADCGATDATWCSLNWCTSLCLKCSGVHRQMSSTTSKVRSVQLDTLHIYIQQLLRLMGNSAANSLLIATPPDCGIGPRTDERQRASFITRKYQGREWATPRNPPDPFEAIANRDFLAFFHAMNFGRGADRVDGISPLHAAVQSGDVILVTIAACCSHEIDGLDGNGWTPFCYALFYGENEIAKFLLAMGAIPEKANMDICALAFYNGDKELINVVLQLPEFMGTSPEELIISSNRFARGRNIMTARIRIPQATKELAKLYKGASKA
jgi:hypothetical protein